MAAAITDVDHGYQALVRRVFQLRKPVLEVGVIEGDQPHGDDGVTILDVATWLEFGTATQPPRSWLRAWFDEDEAHLRDMLVQLMKSVIKGERTPEDALELLGQLAVGRIQERIAAGLEPPNAPSTVAKKGSSTPGIDTGIFRSSISYRVTEEG